MKKKCSVNECINFSRRNGLCPKHSQRQIRHGDTSDETSKRSRSICSIEGCEKFIIGQSLCSKHYTRFINRGDPLFELPTAEERYHSSYIKKGTNECWEWCGPRNKHGYGRFLYRHKETTAHRKGWEFANGKKPPADILVCHKCDNPPCQNPNHLFLGTPLDNMQDMVKKGRHRNQAKAKKLGRVRK